MTNTAELMETIHQANSGDLSAALGEPLGTWDKVPDEDQYFGELVTARRARRVRTVPDEEVWREYGM